jgi:hypothetical protein
VCIKTHCKKSSSGSKQMTGGTLAGQAISQSSAGLLLLTAQSKYDQLTNILWRSAQQSSRVEPCKKSRLELSLANHDQLQNKSKLFLVISSIYPPVHGYLMAVRCPNQITANSLTAAKADLTSNATIELIPPPVAIALISLVAVCLVSCMTKVNSPLVMIEFG